MVTLVLLPQVTALCPRSRYCGRYWTKCSNAKVHGLPPQIRDTREGIVIELDNITELTEGLFDGTKPHRQRTLVFDHTQILNIGKNAFERIKHIQSLTISDNLTDTLQPGTFLGLHMLTHLSLANNYIYAVPTGAFEGLTMLTYLDLSKNRIEELNCHVARAYRHETDQQLRASTCP
jgi:Leucine-rich repeat (LRR) protein